MARRLRSSKRARDTAAEPNPAPSVDGYSDLHVIGRGASATVYRALQDGYDRHVAIKVLNVDMSDRRARRRFDRERSVNGRLSHHPNVVTVLESGLIDGRQPYLAMELFEQGSLADRLNERGPFDAGDVLHHMIRMTGALESAHRLGVLHRDIKPHNILLSNYGEPALADFGIASILENEPSMTAALTVTHAPPELLEGEMPSPQSDVYSLGSTMYTLLAGSPPFAGTEGDGVLAQLMRITTGEVPRVARVEVDDELHELLRWAMARDTNGRPATAMEFGQALQKRQAALDLPRTELPVELDAAESSVLPPPSSSPPSSLPEPAAPPPSDVGSNSATPRQPSSSAPLPPNPPDDLTIDVAPQVGQPVRSIPSPPSGDRTVVGRQAQVRRPRTDEPKQRRTTALVSIAAVVVGAAVAYGGWTLLRGDGAGDAVTVVATTLRPAESGADDGDPVDATLDLSVFAPTDVTLLGNGATTVVTWSDPTDNPDSSFVVRYRLRDDDADDESAWREAGSPERGKLSLDFQAGGELGCVVVVTGVLVDGQLMPVQSAPACAQE